MEPIDLALYVRVSFAMDSPYQEVGKTVAI